MKKFKFKIHDEDGVMNIIVLSLTEIMKEDFSKYYEVECLGMHIGRLDKNAREIFENDLLLVPFGYSGDTLMHESTQKVVWESESYSLDAPDGVTWEDCEILDEID